MKVPLRFQVTEYDCGAVSLLNALSYLLDREEIPAELVKKVSVYALDCNDGEGNPGQGGTSKEAIEYLARWVSNYAKEKNLDIECEYFVGIDVSLDRMKECVNSGGVVLWRTWLDDEHYVIITKIDDNYAYLFDPYYLEKDYYNNDDDIKIVLDKPFSYNRMVKLKRIISSEIKDFTFGPIERRECLLIKKIIDNKHIL